MTEIDRQHRNQPLPTGQAQAASRPSLDPREPDAVDYEGIPTEELAPEWRKRRK